MHMADALLSPAVGGAFLVASGGMIAYSARRMTRFPEERAVPLMGVLGAFVFAAQMINFAVPGTGSSGHLGGGMLLAILLGPHAAFLVIASVLVVQSLFFADGGILALGANIFNLGVWPCFLGFLLYRTIAGSAPARFRLWLASVVSVIVALELGAFGVVLQTLLSGRSELSFGRFTALMAGIHLPIALVEGVVTALVVEFIRALRPGIVPRLAKSGIAPVNGRTQTLAPVLVSMAALAILSGCFLAWFASASPDGLEWTLERVQPSETHEAEPPLPLLARIQDKTAIMPDYALPAAENGETDEQAFGGKWPQVSAETSAAGLLGGSLTFGIVFLTGIVLYRLGPRKKAVSGGDRSTQKTQRSS